MEAIFIYLAKSIFISLVFWGYYKLVLEGKEFHHYNRFYLMISVVLSIVLPLVKVDWFTIEPNNDKLYLFLQYMNGDALTADLEENNLSWSFYLGVFVMSISALLIVRVLFGIFRLMILKSKYPKEKHKDYTMVLTDLPSAPFTFLKNLFWNNSIDIKTTSGEKIFLHELAHINQKHTVDRLFLQFVKAVFWFNPVLYFFHDEVMLIHEYLADQKAIENKDSKAFAAMLLNQHYTAAAISGTSPFFNSTIKKRLDMLKKNHNTKFSYARRVWALPLLFTLSFVYLVQAKNKEIEISNNEIDNFIQQEVAQIKDTIEKPKVIEIKSERKTVTKNADSKDVKEEKFKVEYNSKDGITLDVSDDVDIYLEGNKITKELLSHIKKDAIKDIQVKNGDEKSIHIYLKNGMWSDKSKGEKTMFAVSSYTDDDIKTEVKKSYTINGKEVSEEELKEKYPEIYEKINSTINGNLKSNKVKYVATSTYIDDNTKESTSAYYLDDKEITEEELKEKYPEIYEKVKDHKGKHISVSSAKTISVKDKDGNDLSFHRDKKGNIKTNFDDSNMEIYLNGKKISKEEMLDLKPSDIKEAKVDKSNGKRRMDIFSK